MGFDPVSYLMGKEAGGGGGITPADNGKVVVNGALVAQTAHETVTENGTYDTTTNNSVTLYPARLWIATYGMDVSATPRQKFYITVMLLFSF